MRRDPIVLFDNGTHRCMMFDDLVSGEGVQSNQFLIIDHDQYLLPVSYTHLTLPTTPYV